MKIEKSKLYYCISGGNVIKSAIDWNDESGDFTDKIAVVCNFKEDFHYVQQLFGDVNHNRPLVFINEPYGCKHDGYGYKLITIEELKQFYKIEEERKEPKYFTISKEEWNEYQELKNNQGERLIDLKYCMQCDGTWFYAKYKQWEYKPDFKVLHKVNYQGVDYDMILIGNNLFLGHVI